MNNFLVISIIGSVILTVLLNVLPLLFPGAAAKVKRKIEETAKRSTTQRGDSQPAVKVFFPWKAMLLVSVVLTVLVNLVGYLSR